MIRLCLCILPLLLLSCEADLAVENDWPVAGGSAYRKQFSNLSRIDTANVHDLEVSWIYRTNDAGEGTQIQCNPIVLEGILYATSPSLKLFALDAKSGEELWVFDPAEVFAKDEMGRNVNRGVTYWSDGSESRLFYVVGSYLLSVHARNGMLDTDFGTNGMIDLREGLDRDVSSLYVTATSPGIIYKDLLIMGSRVSEA
ncbi:MAG: pyrroloquinoline quinone-dependent dehydrogenase, partial [Cyclobacteriaceae bacterium]